MDALKRAFSKTPNKHTLQDCADALSTSDSNPANLSATSSSPFFRLPLEIRRMIYAYLLDNIPPPAIKLVRGAAIQQGRYDETTDTWLCPEYNNHKATKTVLYPAILSTCRACAMEASDVLYSRNISRLVSDPFPPPKRLWTTIATQGQFRRLHVDLNFWRWSGISTTKFLRKLRKTFPYLQCLRISGLSRYYGFPSAHRVMPLVLEALHVFHFSTATYCWREVEPCLPKYSMAREFSITLFTERRVQKVEEPVCKARQIRIPFSRK